MPEHIQAILFDMGGTLRHTTKRDPVERLKFIEQLMGLIGSNETPEDFARVLTARQKAYRKWAKSNLAELNEKDLWTRWMLPDFPVDQVSRLAVKLNQVWRDAEGERVMFPETQATVLELFRRGYRLGLVSNTTSSVEVPRALHELGISGCFDTVILSCEVGKRKPGAAILLEATSRMGVQPGQCAYIGNRPDRDVASARGAGFTRTVILHDPRDPASLPEDSPLAPDHFINNLKELLGIFPPLQAHREPARKPRAYDISLSTMWGVKKFAVFSDFFLAASRLGFASIELNHQVSPEMLAGVALDDYRIASIHEPCPAVIAADTLKNQDLLISATDEERRREGVNAIKRSIDLAAERGGSVIVVHAGQIQEERAFEQELYALFEKGESGLPVYQEKKDAYTKRRTALVGAHLAAVKKSLVELLEYAGHTRVRLGIENRYHYFDIPVLDEMGELLELAGPDRLGFIYDVGHAQTLDRLGFFPHEAWLQRFAGRMFGTHLHDVVGIHDHYAPGLGEVDFRRVAGYLPPEAFRTLEVRHTNTPEQVRTGLEILVDTGCVNLIQLKKEIQNG